MRGDGMRENGIKINRDECGITLIIEHRVGHAPKERKRVGVIQDTLVFQQSL